jgi:hypothetical protein
MYFIELITKWIKGKKYERKVKFDPFLQDDIETPVNCEHIFLPLDSTKEYFACSLCGLVVKREDLKDENIFKK